MAGWSLADIATHDWWLTRSSSFGARVLRDDERKIHLVALIQTYLSTMADLGAETWIMHGTLMGWWWNRKVRHDPLRNGYDTKCHPDPAVGFRYRCPNVRGHSALPCLVLQHVNFALPHTRNPAGKRLHAGNKSRLQQSWTVRRA